MKVKIDVKSWNNYSPPPIHTPREGEGAYSTYRYLAPKDNFMDDGCEIVQWDH